MHKPTKFGKYLLLERIAVGGMAEVFVAKAFGVEGFERLLAIKRMLPMLGEDPQFIAMFVDEARLAVQLAHPNIVQVLELGKHEHHLYIAMEYIAGRDLRQIVERLRKRGHPMPVAQACLIVAGVCEALEYAHRKTDALGRPLGIVHRDVSPQNVLVSYEGQVKLIDFGIAKAESRAQRTQTGVLKGKFSYMSPEQVKGHDVDGRTDLFAAGVLLWELICGEKLFAGDSDFAVLEKVRGAAVPSPRSLAPHCPEALERVIFKALASDPSRRHQTASELQDDLMSFTRAGDSVYGSRQLAGWLRNEFADDWENEQARQRAWGAVQRTFGQPANAVIPPDADTLVMPPAVPVAAAAPQPPPAVEPFEERGEPHSAKRDGQQARRRQSQRGINRHRGLWYLLAGAAVAAIAGLVFIFAPQESALRERPRGRLVIAPSPAVPVDLVVDGKAAGQLPPFVRTLSPGKHRVELRAEGYKPFIADVRVPSGRTPLKLEAQLVSEESAHGEGVVLSQPSPAPAQEKQP
jgi:eukaryotic-like serine/threonine-protein kinase